MCEYYSSQGSFPRNHWHKLPLSHYLMTKHSHKPPPVSLLNFTLRAMAQDKPPNMHTCGRHTPLQKTSLLTAKTQSSVQASHRLKSLRSDDMESSKVFMNEARTGGVITPCFQVANTQLSMALFVTLRCNMSISIYESPSL